MKNPHELMWSEASRDVDAERNARAFSLAKVSAQQAAWAFLSAAASNSEYEARYELVADRVTAAVDQVSAGDTALLDQVRTSLQDDHRLLVCARTNDRIIALASEWADVDGPLRELATTATCSSLDDLDLEVLALSYATDDAGRTELAELMRLVGKDATFLHRGTLQKRADASFMSQPYQNIDPSDVPPGPGGQPQFNDAAFEAGQNDGYYGDNAGVEEFGQDPSYQRGLEDGRESAGQDQQQPELFHDGAKTAESHPPYYIRESGGQFKVVDAIGEERGSHGSRSEALAQQRALYANVPGAAQKAEQEHGHTPAAVQDVGHKGSRVEGEYHYIRENNGKWEIWQKGTGKTLQTHDTKEEAEKAFRGMEYHMHEGARWGFLDKQGVFHAVALNEDAYGAGRYETVADPATPSWTNDEYTDHKEVQLGDTPAENHADGTEMMPTAPWLVAEEARGRGLNRPTVTTSGLSWRVPTTLTITADNPFSSAPSDNQFAQPDAGGMGMGTMPSPNDDPTAVGLSPDATSPAFNSDTSTMLPPTDGATDIGGLGDDMGGGLGGGSLGDDTNMAPTTSADTMDSMPAPEDDTTSSPNAFTSSRAPTLVDQLAAVILATNPGLPLTRCVAMAKQTVAGHPELQPAGQR